MDKLKVLTMTFDNLTATSAAKMLDLRTVLCAKGKRTVANDDTISYLPKSGV